jgi:integrase
MAQKLNNKAVEALKPLADKDLFVWDTLAGFGVRVYPTGRKVFVVQTTVGQSQRRIKVGKFGLFTVEQARDKAREILRKAGEGIDVRVERREAERQAKQVLTVGELCELYMKATRHGLAGLTRGRPKRLSTLYDDNLRLTRHIIPFLGDVEAKSLTRAQVQRAADAIAAGHHSGHRTKGGPIAAERATQLFGAVLEWGMRRDYIPDGPNPAHRVQLATSAPRDRILSDEELTRLGQAMRARPGTGADLLSLILMAGLRRNEAARLKWSEVDFACKYLRLQTTKTGKSDRPVGAAALDLLRGLPRDDEYCFPGRQSHVDVRYCLPPLFKAAGIEGVTLHDCRRTYASVAANLGYSDGVVGELMGHTARGVTARHYIRRADPVLVAAADRVAGRVRDALDGKVGQVIELPARNA